MKELIASAPRFLFFTGKGGVGKTSMSCVVALALADQGKQYLLISTDPASNLDEVLETPLSGRPTLINGQPGLWAMNIDPVQAAAEYRERIVALIGGYYQTTPCNPSKNNYPEPVQLRSRPSTNSPGSSGMRMRLEYDHVILDTAPTGHTLRLLSLPAAWNDFLVANTSGSSCLGPLSGLKDQRLIYENAVKSLTDPRKTLLILVARAEGITLREAARASAELCEIGMKNQHLIINGHFQTPSSDPVARAFSRKSEAAMA